jgi:hypothetical protein
VPAIFPLSHDEVIGIIKKGYPDLAKHWGEFQEIFSEEKTLSPLVQTKLLKIRRGIEKALDNCTKDDLGALAPFLDQVTASGAVLMVRSSGKEDSDMQANAGGNESIAGVKPEPKTVLAAMARVVCSYFSVHSLEQRLSAGDDITTEPFTPVLLQVMIGEDLNRLGQGPDSIPISGVAYTRDISTDSKDLVRIDAIPGHNHALVNGLLINDSYFIGKGLVAQSLVLEKPVRYVAERSEDGENHFKTVANPPELKSKSSLNPSVLARLEQVSRKIDEHYGKAMDIEWVYDPTTDSIHIVQARPIVANKGALPSYFQAKKDVSVRAESALPIVHVGGSCVSIDKDSEVIIAADLEQALSVYLHQQNAGFKEGKPKAVIVRGPGSPLSHPACVFRENGISVVWSKDAPSTPPMIIDVQQEQVFSLPKDPFEREALGEIKEGWVEFPMRPNESLLTSQDTLSEEQWKEVFNTLFRGLKLSKREREELRLSSLIKTLSSQEQQDANTAVKQLAYVFYKAVRAFAPESEEAQALLRHVLLLGQQYVQSSDHMTRLYLAKRIKSFAYQLSERGSIGLSSLESILSLKKHGQVDEIESKSAWQGVDIKDLDKWLLDERVFDETLSGEDKVTMRSVCALIGGQIASDELKTRWTHFYSKVLKSESKFLANTMMSLVADMEKQGILSEWLVTSFHSGTQGYPHTATVTKILRERLLPEYEASLKDFNDLAQINETLSSWNEIAALWADPDHYDSLHEDFLENAAPMIRDLLSRFGGMPSERQKSLTGILLRKKTMEAITVWDTAIKHLRGSPAYSANKELQARRMYQMLGFNYALMNSAMDKVPRKKIVRWCERPASTLPPRQRCSAAEYLRRMRAELHSKWTTIGKSIERLGGSQNYFTDSESPKLAEDLLRPSMDFNVNQATFNSGYDYERAFSSLSSLEDWFTLMHQNLITAVTSHDSVKLADLPLDPKFRSVIKSLQKGIADGIAFADVALLTRPQLENVSFQAKHVQVDFNIPIKLHSGKLSIKQEIPSKRIVVDLDLLMPDNPFVGNRGSTISRMFNFRTILSGLELEKAASFDASKNSLQARWNVPNEPGQLGELIKLIKLGIRLSITARSGETGFDFHELSEEQKKALVDTVGIWCPQPEQVAPRDFHLARDLVNDALKRNRPELARKILQHWGMRLEHVKDEDLESAFTGKALEWMVRTPDSVPEVFINHGFAYIDLQHKLPFGVRHFKRSELAEYLAKEPELFYTFLFSQDPLRRALILSNLSRLIPAMKKPELESMLVCLESLPQKMENENGEALKEGLKYVLQDFRDSARQVSDAIGEQSYQRIIQALELLTKKEPLRRCLVMRVAGLYEGLKRKKSTLGPGELKPGQYLEVSWTEHRGSRGPAKKAAAKILDIQKEGDDYYAVYDGPYGLEFRERLEADKAYSVFEEAQ